MKKYIKPVTDVENALTTDIFMLTISDDGTPIPGGGAGGGGGDAKEREEFEDAEMIQLLKDHEEGKANLW